MDEKILEIRHLSKAFGKMWYSGILIFLSSRAM